MRAAYGLAGLDSLGEFVLLDHGAQFCLGKPRNATQFSCGGLRG